LNKEQEVVIRINTHGENRFLCRGLKLVVLCGLFFFICLQSTSAKETQKIRSQEKTPEKCRLITLSEGIEMVLKDSRLIRVTLLDQDMALQNSLIARSALLPHLNATVSQTFNRFQPTAKLDNFIAPTSNKEYLSYGFDVYQTLFDFGKSLSNYRASKEMIRASEANIDSVRRVAILEFVVAYFNVLEAEKMITVAEKEVESLESYLSDIQHLYEQGSAVKNDLLPAQVRLADAKQKLISARSAKSVAVARLNNILALPLGDETAVEDIKMKPPELPLVEGAWKVAQKLRPEIAFYERQIQASRLSAKAKSVANLPTVYADGGYSYLKNQFQVHQDNAFFELGAKMNFYDGGAARAELLKERARQRQLKEEKDKLTEDIKFEIEDSYVGLKDACEKALVAKDAVSQAAENVRVNRARYAAGSATSTEVLEAITLETRAQTNFYSTDFEVKRSYSKLMYSMGIDLSLIYETMERKNEYAK
jgi:outer membrane protein